MRTFLEPTLNPVNFKSPPALGSGQKANTSRVTYLALMHHDAYLALMHHDAYLALMHHHVYLALRHRNTYLAFNTVRHDTYLYNHLPSYIKHV